VTVSATAAPLSINVWLISTLRWLPSTLLPGNATTADDGHQEARLMQTEDSV